MLYIGDSVGHNADFSGVERAVNGRIRTRKAYSSVHDARAKWPKKNFMDITPLALMETREDDPFSHLVLAAPTVDISNLDTSKFTEKDNIEALHQNIIISCKNMFTTAQIALQTFPNLQKVVIMDHAPRFDPAHVDPLGLKPELARFANATFSQLWFTSPLKEKVSIGSHKLDFVTENIGIHFQNTNARRHDGVHMYTLKGKIAFTKSTIKALKNALSVPNQTESKDQTYKKKTTKYQSSSNVFTIPVSNRFENLGN